MGPIQNCMAYQQQLHLSRIPSAGKSFRIGAQSKYSDGEVGASRTKYLRFCLPPPTYDLEYMGTSSALVTQAQMGACEKNHTYISSIKVKVLSKISVKMARPMVCDLIPVTSSMKMVFPD